MIPIPKRWKRAIQGSRKRWRLRWRRWRFGFGRQEFGSSLREVGIGPGSVVLIHISWDSFDAFDGTVSDVIRCLQETVGDGGTLLMPTMSFQGSAIDFVEGRDLVDLRRTPSRMGLPTELFRRMPGVVRSIHPTHPVAAWGALATAMTADHHACSTPCGRDSPFGRLLDHGGQILFIGTGIESMTFFHTAEEILEKELPRSPFTGNRYDLKTADQHGRIHETTTRLFDREISGMRRIQRIVPILKERDQWHTCRLGNLEIVRLGAREVLDAIATALQRGISIYDDGIAQ